MRPVGNRPWILATLASIAFLTSAAGARASTITIKWSDDDTAVQTTTISSTNGTYSFLGGLADTTDFTNIVGKVTTNDNNFTPDNIKVMLSLSGDRKTPAIGANKTLKVIAIDSNFTVSGRPYQGNDTIGGNANAGDLVKNTSDFNPTPPPPSLLTLVVSETTPGSGTLTAMTTSGLFTAAGGGFTLQDTLELTEAPGEIGQGFAAGTTQAITPEPVSVLSALSGLAVVGLGAWMRRKKAVVV